jgi:ribulose 1,5-bisphosphate synthetase/thiazole synthase
MMSSSYDFSRNIPEYDSADVVIIGGGPSGIGAAIGAARCGKKVILCEQSAQLGGMATLGNVAIFMWTENFTGLYKEIMMDLNPKKRTINERGGPTMPQFDPFRMRLYEKCASEGVKVMYHTQFIGVLKDNARITGVAVHTREGLQAVTAPQFIDCTGDARVAMDAGAEYTSGRPEDGLTQPMTLMFAMQDTGKPVERDLPPGCPEYNSVEELP